MSDPFSIASGAVGIISLGIQLCKEITKYTEAWRGYDDDIESINLKAKSLETPLKRLREFVEDTRLTDAQTANDVAEKALGLDRHLKRLKERLVLVQPIISESLADQVRNKFKRATYPLRARDALRDIKTNLDEVQSTIDFALTIFNAQQTQKSYLLQERGLQLLEEIHLTISSTSRKDMPAPALLKSLCDRVDQLHDPFGPRSQYKIIPQDDDLNPYAATRLSERPLYPRRKSQRVSTKKLFQCYSSWFHRQLTLSFSLSTGAGAFSIAPVLEMRVYRGPNSWVESRFSQKIDSIYNAVPVEAYHSSLRHHEIDLIRDFQQAVSAGEVGPHDIMPNGESIVSWAFGSCNSLWKPGIAPALSNFLLVMIEAGFKVNSNQGDFYLDYLFDYEWTLHDESFALSMIDHGGPIDWFPNTRQAKKNLRRLLVIDKYLVDLPEIAKIILMESVPNLREALQSGLVKSNDVIECPLWIGTKRYMRHRLPLELAVGWPDGVFMLLDFGADASEVDLGKCSYRTEDANDLDCDDFRTSLAPLLQRRCIMGMRDITRCKSKIIRNLLIYELTNRRQKLHDVARSCLSQSRLAEITGPETDESILDLHAFQVYAELVAINSKVEPSLSCDAAFDEAAYHNPCALIDAWDDLYLAGFRDIDAPNSKGLTPLMVAVFDFAGSQLIWLVEKGASLSKRLPSSNTTVAHLISSRFVGKALCECGSGRKYHHAEYGFSKSIKIHRETIFLVPSMRDCCTCFCSDGGCTTLSVALRECNAGSYYSYSYEGAPPPRNIYLLVLHSLLDLTEKTKERDHAIIRFMTFESLGLRHTCCREIRGRLVGQYYAENIMDEGEIRNIQEEDQHGYQQLDELVEEFKTHFDDLQLPIIDFLKGPWHARMARVLSTRDPYDEEHILQNRQNGVFLEPVESHDIPFFFSLFGSQIEELEPEASIASNGDGGGDDEGKRSIPEGDIAS